MNENPNENEFTAENGEIRFDPEKDREKHTEAEVEKVKKPKKAKKMRGMGKMPKNTLIIYFLC